MADQQYQRLNANHHPVTLRVLDKSSFQAASATFLICTKGAILCSNMAGCELLGSSFSGVAGKRLTHFLATQDVPALRTVLSESVGQEVCSPISVTVVSLRGRRTLCSLTFSTLHDESGRPSNIVVNASPTEMWGTHIRSLQAQRLMSLETLAGGVAHTLNNALTGLLMNAQMAQIECRDDPVMLDRLAGILHSGRRLADICNELLSFTGDGPLATELLCLNQLIAGMWPTLAGKAGDSIRLERSLANDLPEALCNAVQVRKVIFNLYDNALESIEEAGIIRLVTNCVLIGEGGYRNSAWGPAPRSGRYVLFSISDTGCGMDESVLAHACDPFFTTKFTGRGLGLSSTVGIVRAHGGFVELQSRPGAGTTVRVFLPGSLS